MHLRAQTACHELKEDLIPVLLKEIFHDRFENFEFTSVCMENHVSVTGWQSCFSHSNTPNFWQALQWLLLRYRQIHLDVIVYILEDVAIYTN